MNKKRWFLILLALLIVFTFGACGKADPNTEVLAKVGEREITQAQLDQYTYLYAFLQGVDLSNVDEETMASVKEMILEEYINLVLIGMHYQDDATILPEEYETERDDFIKTLKEDETSGAYLKQYEISDAFLDEFYKSQYYSAAFFDDLKTELPEITEDDLKAYYESNPDEFVIDEVAAKHILVEDKDLAEELLAELKNGADFATLAEENSIDTTSAVNGGDLGTFGRNVMITEFEEAAFALEPGELSSVVQTDYGYHIILVTEKNQGTESYEDSKTTIQYNLENQALSEIYTVKIEELRGEYKVEYTK